MTFNGQALATALYANDNTINQIFNVVNEYKQLRATIMKSISEGNLKGLSEGLKTLGAYIKKYATNPAVSAYVNYIKPIYQGLREYGRVKQQTEIFELTMAKYAQEAQITATNNALSETSGLTF